MTQKEFMHIWLKDTYLFGFKNIQNFESIVSFNINRNLCKKNVEIRNSKKSTNPKEFRSTLDKGSIFYKIKKRFKIKSNFTYIIFLINSLKSIKFFK